MDYRLTWSLEAIKDVEQIAEYIARDSPRYASVVVDKLTAMAAKIASSPRSGRMTPEFGMDEIRERTVFSYRLIYRIEPGVITLAAVIHGKRLLGERESILRD